MEKNKNKKTTNAQFKIATNYPNNYTKTTNHWLLVSMSVNRMCAEEKEVGDWIFKEKNSNNPTKAYLLTTNNQRADNNLNHAQFIFYGAHAQYTIWLLELTVKRPRERVESMAHGLA